MSEKASGSTPKGDEDDIDPRTWRAAHTASHLNDSTPSGLHKKYARLSKGGNEKEIETFRITGQIVTSDIKTRKAKESSAPATESKIATNRELTILAPTNKVAAEVLKNLEHLESILPQGPDRERAIIAQLKTAFQMLSPEIKALRGQAPLTPQEVSSIVSELGGRSNLFQKLDERWKQLTPDQRDALCHKWAHAMGKPEIQTTLRSYIENATLGGWLERQMLVGELNYLQTHAFFDGATSLLGEIFDEIIV